jgi:hypothetical protein
VAFEVRQKGVVKVNGKGRRKMAQGSATCAPARFLRAAFAFVLAACLVISYCIPVQQSAQALETHTPTKISVAAYPVQGDGQTWDIAKGSSKTISTRGGTLRLRVAVTWNDGVVTHESSETEWESRSGFSEGFTYKSEDEDTLTVNSIGIVTALKNGTTKVTVTPVNSDFSSLHAVISITTTNQKGGLLVKKVEVVNENNKPYGDTAVKFTQLQQTKKFYTRVTYKNQDAAKYYKSVDLELKTSLDNLEKEKNEKLRSLETNKDEALRKLEKEEKEALDKAKSESEKDKIKDGYKSKKTAVNKEYSQKASTVRQDYSNKSSKVKSDSASKKQEVREKVVYSNAPQAPSEESPNAYEKKHYYKTVADAFSTLAYQAGDTEYLAVDVHEGVATVKALANCMTRIYAHISGGDESKDVGFGYGRVYDTVAVNVNDATRARTDGELPSDTFNIRVVYADYPDRVVRNKVYTVKQFEQLGTITRSYTLTRKGGHYVTERARGVPLARLLNSIKIDADDVSYFTLAANDGANPGRLSARFLLKTNRYYLPNYDLGGSWAEKERVPTMIALADSWNSDTTVTGELNSGTRFRLVFGAATSADQATDKSIKFINTMTVVLKGSPPSTKGNGDHNISGGGNSGSGSDTGPGNGSGTTTGDGNGSGVGTNSGASSASGGSGVSQSTGTNANNTIGAADPNATEGQQASWSAYQMMSASKSDAPLDLEQTDLGPWVILGCCVLLAIALVARYVWFRRGLGKDGAKMFGKQLRKPVL